MDSPTNKVAPKDLALKLKELSSKVSEELTSIATVAVKGGSERKELTDAIFFALDEIQKKKRDSLLMAQIINCAAPLTARVSDHNVLLVLQGTSVFAKAVMAGEKTFLTFYAHIDGPIKDLLLFVFKKCLPEIEVLEGSAFTRPSEI